MFTINELFRKISAYTITSVSEADLNECYILMAKDAYTHLCELTFTLVDDDGDWTSEDTTHPELESIHNTILAELAASKADEELDKINIDPITGMMTDLHYERAIEMMKNHFGIRDEVTGDLILPLHLRISSTVLADFPDSSY